MLSLNRVLVLYDPCSDSRNNLLKDVSNAPRNNLLNDASNTSRSDSLRHSRSDSHTVETKPSVVGTLARTRDGLFAFEYHDDWIKDGFSLNPLSLPLEKRVFIARRDLLDGMFGVFRDSLPDGWGRLLVDRSLSAHGEDPLAIDDLIRLAIVGSSGMGALVYESDYSSQLSTAAEYREDLDVLATECAALFSADSSADYSADLDTLFALGASSGGARPKVLIAVDGQDWIIKFASTIDPKNIGEQEYAYASAAQACGIEMPQTHLFPSRLCPGYFGVRRFDRGPQGQRIHMASAAGLLETSHRTPNLDYHILMKLTLRLTQDISELKRLFRLMCFNVFAHNRDDHSKNFSFLFYESEGPEGTRSSEIAMGSERVEGRWRLSPAYDLTYSSSFRGEHATTINGNGKDPGHDDILAVARQAGISLRWAKAVADEIEERTEHLKRFWR